MSVEYFKECGNDIRIDKTKKTIVMASYFNASAYGTVPISSYSNKIHKWTFKINKKGTNSIAIGIDDSNGKYIEEFPFGKTDSNNYCYWSRGQKQSMRETISYNEKWNFK
eukprot:163883_1